jgi:adenosylcobinamide-phosphate synthase
MEAPLVRAGAVLAAFFLDRIAGEPPASLHPVVWMGKALSATGAPWPKRPPSVQFCRGVIVWIVGAGTLLLVTGFLILGLDRLLSPIGGWGRLTEALLIGVVLKPMLSWRMLYQEVAGVEQALARGVDDGRRQLSRLVSRDTAALSETVVRESALESLAENLNDSLVAPLFWFTLGGLPLAVLYRFANTADAMWGYRGRFEWAGKWAARADDVLSFIPARLTALLLAVTGRRLPRGLAVIARVTPSPNGGWPMGMLAMALGVRLSKPGVYALNPEGGAVQGEHLMRGLRVCDRAASLAVALSVGILVSLGLWA